ncbi:MAG: hypothetical protein WCW35_12740 [Bacteroidota bacterium]
MIHWQLKIETELQRVRREHHPGRVRTTARRIVGIALQRYENRTDEDFLRLMHDALRNESLPEDVRSAIQRLAARIDENFSSPSIDPIADAMIVVGFVKESVA